MTDQDLMQQALEALTAYDGTNGASQRKRVLAALRERLAQPQMQPCAGRNCGSTNPNLHSAECFEDYEKATGMNQWRGLTVEEIIDVIHPLVMANMADETTDYEIARAIESKLREKNA
jgi:hypothetical protein